MEMICTARALLAREGLALGESVYDGAGEGYLDYPMSMGDFFERVSAGAGQWALRYKHHLRMTGLKSVHRCIPELERADLDWLADRPLFTERLAELEGMDRGTLAVEGGPCLYGADEVDTLLTLRNGERLCFDDSSGVCIGLEGGPSLPDFLRARGGEVAKVSFVNRKDGFSAQELELTAALFAAASALACPLVFSLPDMSYRKYFSRLARHLPDGVREEAEAAYGGVVHQITDLYLELARRMEARWPVPRLTALHERDVYAYGTFLQERERYCNIDDVTTNRPDMRGAIYDYITLPAAPHYLFGAEHVLEINSTDEADPLRKCAKLHKKHVRFHQLMLPEPISTDGRHTIFTAGRAHKGYVTLEALGEAGRAAGGV